MKKFDVVGFGALNVDKLYRVSRIAREDEESFVIEFREACGGSAANTVVGLARLGLKTGFIGKVSKDREGRILLEEFRREGVDTGGIILAEGGRSGVVLGFVDPRGERALYVDPGVNDRIEFGELNFEYVRNTRFLHLTSFVGEKSFEAQKRLVEGLPSGVLVSFDPGALYARRGMSSLRPIIERSFVMLPNETELRLLTRKDYKAGAKALIDEGISVVAVKLGEKGCYVTDGEESRLVKPFEAKVIDTTGAGDAFNAGFLYGLFEGKDLQECGRLGNLVAAHCITKIGARTGLPTRSELEKNLV